MFKRIVILILITSSLFAQKAKFEKNTIYIKLKSSNVNTMPLFDDVKKLKALRVDKNEPEFRKKIRSSLLTYNAKSSKKAFKRNSKNLKDIYKLEFRDSVELNSFIEEVKKNY